MKMNLSDQNILAQRAQLLSQKPNDSEAPGNPVLVIVFHLMPERYAIEGEYVQEVLTLKQITPIPGTPEYIMGVINHRGDVVSIINLKALLGIRERGLSEMNKVLLLRNQHMSFGLIADGIRGSVVTDLDKLRDPPATLSQTGLTFIKGLTDDGSILLDAGKLLDSKSLIINQ